MTAWGVTTKAIALSALLAAGCSGEDGGADPTTTEASAPVTGSTTVPERPASTTTTAFDPASVEGQVEAAYLRSWDVYADAVYDLVLDEEALAEVYAETHLETVTAELERRIAGRRTALVRVEHNYSISGVDEKTFVIVDTYVNHQVLIDPETKQPIEEDPNESVTDVVTLKLIGSKWRVVLIEELADA